MGRADDERDAHPPTFSVTMGRAKRQPRVHNEAYLAFVRRLPCVVSGRAPVEAAHVRYGDATRGKRMTGAGTKPDDRWVVPLAPDQHRDQHAHNEREWWESKGIDPLLVAALLFSHFSADDEEAATATCLAARHGFLSGAEPRSVIG